MVDKVMFKGKMRKIYKTKRGAGYIRIGGGKRYVSTIKPTRKPKKRGRGRPKKSRPVGRPRGPKKRGRPKKSRPVGRPPKKGVKRLKGGRISRAKPGAKRGRPAKYGGAIPKTITEGGRRYKRTGKGHKSAAIARRNAPKMHRIRKFGSKHYIFTRGRD